MNTQPYLDRLLENENLTADLEDAEADWLIQWGIAQIDIVTEGLTEETAADEKISALMSLMRRISRTVARKDRRTPAELAEGLCELETMYAQAFGQTQPHSPADGEQAAARLQAISALEAIQFLVEWLALT
jgi:hypothetical protein